MAISINSTVVLITGVSKGIGKGLIEAYLLRPNHIVIGSVRDKSSPNYAELKKLPTAEGSRLILISIENSELDGPEKALKDVASQGIDHIDVIIANAAICPYPAPLQNVAVQDVLDALRINAVSPVQLYHATRPFLAKSSQPVWLSLSSVVGSIKNVEIHKADSFLAYGVSKSALGFFTMAVHAAHPDWISYAVHPGLVQTELGNAGARMQGMEEAPITIKDCCSSIIASVENATRAETSGRFIDLSDNHEIPW